MKNVVITKIFMKNVVHNYYENLYEKYCYYENFYEECCY